MPSVLKANHTFLGSFANSFQYFLSIFLHCDPSAVLSTSHLSFGSHCAIASTWHSEDHKKDGKLRAPADGSQCRKIERKYWAEFAADPRNVWFGLSADGINPFGEQSSNHSTCPVTLCMFNLPPWMCMKRKFIMMPVLIQGPKQPDNDIDVYLRPLVEELL